jgi:hypothetical protein
VDKDAKTIGEDDVRLSQELAAIKSAVDEEREAAKGASVLVMFKNGPQKFLYRTMLGIGGQFMQQISGTNPKPPCTRHATL